MLESVTGIVKYQSGHATFHDGRHSDDGVTIAAAHGNAHCLDKNFFVPETRGVLQRAPTVADLLHGVRPTRIRGPRGTEFSLDQSVGNCLWKKCCERLASGRRGDRQHEAQWKAWQYRTETRLPTDYGRPAVSPDAGTHGDVRLFGDPLHMRHANANRMALPRTGWYGSISRECGMVR